MKSRSTLVLALAATSLAAASARAGGEPIRLRHPLVMAHGAAWVEGLNIERLKGGDYWTGAADHLRSLGVQVIAPEVEPTGSIEARAKQLKAAIRKAYPRGKVNIMAHGMGGLDSRYMISKLKMGRRVRSLTTVATPHHGSFYADFAKRYIFEAQGGAWAVDRANLDYTALRDLTTEYMAVNFNPFVKDDPRVDYFSYAGVTSIWKVPLPQWGAKLLMTAIEKTAVGQRIGPATSSALAQHVPGGIRAAQSLGLGMRGWYQWVRPDEAGRSDGVVSTSSSRWGFYMGEVKAYHLAQIGSSRSVDHKAIWERIVRKLAELGY